MKKLLTLTAVIIFNGLYLYSFQAEILEVEGEVDYLIAAEANWLEARTGLELSSGDRLRTGPDSSAVLRFAAGHTADMSQNSLITVNEAEEDKTDIGMFNGKLRSRVREMERGESYSVTTPQAVAAVRGTEFEVTVRENETLVNVISGRVEAMEIITGDKVIIPAGRYSRIVPRSAPEIPQEMPERDIMEDEPQEEKREEDEEGRAPPSRRDIRDMARREMVQERRRDIVQNREIDEIRSEEFEAGRSFTDVWGNRVRVEHYIKRDIDNEFTHVTLNERDRGRARASFTYRFDRSLPDDLAPVMGSIYVSTEEPEYILNEFKSEFTNKTDYVYEIGTGGDMPADDSGVYFHRFEDYKFFIKGGGFEYRDVDQPDYKISEKYGKKLWHAVGYSKFIGDHNYIYVLGVATGELEKKVTRPSGDDYHHWRREENYYRETGGDDYELTWLSRERFFTDGEGNILQETDLSDTLNFEVIYKSSEFGDRDISLFFTPEAAATVPFELMPIDE